ncbi:ergot alkaloid A [Ephemerocybe angulata]|uniref:Ergot alkaloid A n=1 Tax=Ephemerocybe angulata TaxID=980116 RepID=A0A8H6HFY2_9AGAR|nr:ergot alkaloid A [Tulosesus angulatus]
MTKSILLTGGASQVGVAIARLLKQSGNEVVFASRSGRVPDGFKSVRMDWYDTQTFANIFPGDPALSPYHSVYLLCPPFDLKPYISVNPFIDICLERGVKKFVLLGGTDEVADGNDTEYVEIQRHLEKKGCRYVVLRPTWFCENFLNYFGESIRTTGAFTTSVATGKIPFVAVEDVAQVGYKALVEEDSAKEKVIIGPELLTYDQAATTLSQILRRQITHISVSKDDLIEIYDAIGSHENSLLVAGLEERAEAGTQERWWDMSAIQNVKDDERDICIGRMKLAQWAEGCKDRLV